MPTAEKKQAVEQLTDEVKQSTGLVFTAFQGLKTTEINEFRHKLRPLKGTYKIVKNSLTRIALKNAGMDALVDALKGPSAVVIERGDPIATAKAVFEFAKTHEKFRVNGGYFEGKVVTQKELTAIAALPSREVLLSQFLGTLQAPVANLGSALQAPVQQLLSVLDQLSKKAPEQK